MDPEKERLEQNSSGRDEIQTAKGCTSLDQIRNEDVINELGISPLSEKNNRIQELMESTCAKNGTYPHSTTGI
jgi:hypothetical protein